MDNYQYSIPPAGCYHHCVCQPPLMDNSASQSQPGFCEWQTEFPHYIHSFDGVESDTSDGFPELQVGRIYETAGFANHS